MAVSHVELVIRRPGSPDRRIVLQPGVLSIGRADDNDIVLSDIGVSRRHAKLHVDENSVEYEDNGSGNGSLYNGRRFKRQRLGDGDEIVVDPFRLQVLLAAETDEANLSTAATLKLGGLEEGFARLELTSNHRMERTAFEIPAEGMITLGRGDRNEIVLPEPAASRVHSEIVGHLGNWTVRDRASANGTYVNGRKVREQVLRDGDKLRIGTVELKFFAPGGEGTANFVGSTPAPASRPVNTAATLPGQRPIALPTPAKAPLSAEPTGARPIAPPEPRALNPSAGRPTVVRPAASPTLVPGYSTPPAPRPPGFFANPVNTAVVAVSGLAVVGLVLTGFIVVAAVAWKAHTQQASIAAATVLPPETAAQVVTLLAEGKKLQSEDKHFEAAAQFYKVLQIDPGNAVAERLGYRACGDIAFAQMRTALPPVAATVAPAPTPSVPHAAAVAPAAPAPARIPVARTTTSAPPQAAPVARSVPDLSGTYARGQSLADSGDNAGAIKVWQGLMSMDPDHVTPEYYQAEAAVRSARAEVKDEGNKHYQAALTALSSKQYATARQQLEQAVAADPFNNAARAKLTEVRNELGAQAQDIYKEARIQEDIDKTSDAIRMYKQVISLVGESDELGAKAKRRMDALQGR